MLGTRFQINTSLVPKQLYKYCKIMLMLKHEKHAYLHFFLIQ